MAESDVKQKTKAKILHSSAALFTAASIDGVSVEAIIADAGIVRSSFYRHFKGKSELLKAIIDPMFFAAADKLVMLESKYGRVLFDGIADIYIWLWQEHRHALLLSGSIGPGQFPLVMESHNRFADALMKNIERLGREGLLLTSAEKATKLAANASIPMLKILGDDPESFRRVFAGALLKSSD